MTKTNRRQFLKIGLGAVAVPLVASAAKAAGHAVHVIEIKGHKFSPSSLEMEAGDSVQFVNLDGAPHTGTDKGGKFNTGRLNRGDDKTIKITAKGTYNYFCEFHPGMTGRIVAS